jgi:hypothetical protein
MHFLVYAAFLFLFLKFFYNSYLSKGGRSEPRIQPKAVAESNGKIHSE